MATTYPNQWKIIISEKSKSSKNYTLIKGEVLFDTLTNLNSRAVFAIWYYCYTHLANINGSFTLTVEKICKETGISKTQCYTGIKTLVEKGYIIPEVSGLLKFYPLPTEPHPEIYCGLDYISRGEDYFPEKYEPPQNGIDAKKNVIYRFENDVINNMIQSLRAFSAIQMWFFFQTNQEGFEFYLSYVYANKLLKIPNKSYHNAIKELISKNYLSGKGLNFYEFRERGSGFN